MFIEFIIYELVYIQVTPICSALAMLTNCSTASTESCSSR